MATSYTNKSELQKTLNKTLKATAIIMLPSQILNLGRVSKLVYDAITFCLHLLILIGHSSSECFSPGELYQTWVSDEITTQSFWPTEKVAAQILHFDTQQALHLPA